MILPLFGAAAIAAPLRVGVFVGNDAGAAGQERLLFASTDAEKMRDLFVEYGGIAPQDAMLVTNQTRRDVQEALRQAGLRVAAARARGDDATVVFFYSGHGDEGALQLGTTVIGHAEWRAWLEQTGATVKLAFLDACHSGAAVRDKGVQKGPSYAFDVQAEALTGTAVLTSSARSERSQESSEIGGGFFTYYLHSALLGAGDADGNGEVTLSEAAAHVYAETAIRTTRAAERQTPTADLDLVGSGELWLTRLTEDSATLVFPGDFSGTWSVWDEDRRRYVAEVDGARPTNLAVPPGEYFIHHRMPGWVEEAEYVVGDGDHVAVRSSDFVSVPYTETASRGDLERQVRHATRPLLSARLLVGGRGFGQGTPMNAAWLPSHAVAGVSLRALPTHRHVYFGGDLLGGAGQKSILLDGSAPIPVFVQSTSLAGEIGWATRDRPLRAGAGARGEFISFSRKFPENPEVTPQGLFTIAPGVGTWVGFHYGRFVADLTLNLHVLPVRLDGAPESPSYGELMFAVGARF